MKIILVEYKSVASTQDVARILVEKHGFGEGTVVVAEKQTRGRGRIKRRWSSCPGGIWMTVVLKPCISPHRLAGLSLVVSLALMKAIKSFTGIDTKLKWPNDVMIKNSSGEFKKLAGVLVETVLSRDKVKNVYIGIGVNVFNKIPEVLNKSAVCLVAYNKVCMNKRAVFLRELRTGIIKVVNRDYLSLKSKGFKYYMHKCNRVLAYRNRLVNVTIGEKKVQCRVMRIDTDAGLVVKTGGRSEKVVAGEICEI
ncbi:MAG: biotin--[acetyl-CoA-carboxylase] ligase [Elusimicrobiota bacterium]